MNVPHPLKTLCELATQLMDLLLRERQTLIQNDLTTLADITHRKEACIALLIERELELKELLSRSGLSEKPEDMPIWLERQRFTITPWHQLCATLGIIRNLNSVNGTIINRAERNTQRLLEILTGQPSVTTYRHNGLHSQKSMSRTYGCA